MAREPRPTKLRVDGDGVRTIQAAGIRPSVWLLLAAVGLVCLVLLILIRPLLRPTESPIVAAPAPQRVVAAVLPTRAAERPAAGAAVPRVRLEPRPKAAAPPAAAPEAAPLHEAPSLGAASVGDAPTDAEDDAAAAAELDENAPSGIALFPPPGTDPPKSGILVPEDFELPSGYLRHHQSTDDGKQLPAILKFHPDYQLVDERGEPLPMPADGVVPPDMAPPGLAIEILEIPEPEPEVPGDPGGQDSTP